MDVENWANLVIGFEDGSRGNIVVSDVGLGGLNTRVTTSQGQRSSRPV